MWVLSKYKTHGRASLVCLFLAFRQVVLEESISYYVTGLPLVEPSAKMKSACFGILEKSRDSFKKKLRITNTLF